MKATDLKTNPYWSDLVLWGRLPVTRSAPAEGALRSTFRLNARRHKDKSIAYMLRILIADDHDIVRCGLRRLIETHEGWEVVAEAGDGKEAIGKAVETKPDVAVLDYSMPLINGVETTRQIRARLPNTEVLIFSVYDCEVRIQDCLRAGARGYVLKSDVERELIDAIELLAAHKPYFTPKASEVLLDCVLRKCPDPLPLKDREQRLVQLIADGYTNREIANHLHISVGMTEAARATLMRKLGLSSSADIVLYAVRNGLVEP
jgi:DNA-binding NarL/FixJ family response regulator